MDLALYERALADTGRIVAGVRDDQLDLPTPCSEWDVRELLTRLVDVNWGFAGGDGGADRAAELADDRLAAYQRSAAAVLATFSRPETMDREFAFAVRTLPGSDAVWIAMASASVHGWDLATATWQDPTIAPGIAERLLEFMNDFVTDELRRPPLCLFAPAMAVHEDASPTDRLVAFLGRKP